MAVKGTRYTKARATINNLLLGYPETVRAYGQGCETSYSTYSNDFDVSDYSQITIFGRLWKGTLSAVDVYVYWSHDLVNWAQGAVLDVESTGNENVKRRAIHFDESASRAVAIPVEARYFRIQWVGYGTASAATHFGLEFQPMLLWPA